jgi:hypothetical protein
LHRIADEYNSIGKWFAVKLADGESDGVLYDSKRDAVTHQKHMEMYYAYVQVGPWQMTVDDAAAFLKLHRAMYSKGVRLADRDHKSGGKDMIRRISRTDQRAQVRGSLIGDTRPTNIIHGGS